MTWELCALYTVSLCWFVWVFHCWYDRAVDSSSNHAVLFLVWAVPQYVLFLASDFTVFGDPLPDSDRCVLLSGYLTVTSVYLYSQYRHHRLFLRSFYGLTVLYTLPWWYITVWYQYPTVPCLESWWTVTWLAVFSAGLHWTARYLSR